jgi:hypothetical protein
LLLHFFHLVIGGFIVAWISLHDGHRSLVLEHFNLCSQLQDLPFHLFLAFVNLWQIKLSFFQVENIQIDKLQLLHCQVLVPVTLVRVQRIVLPESIPELGSFSFELLDLVFEFSALGFVIFKLLLFGDFDFFQIEAKVVRNAVEFSEDFVLGHDVFHVSGQFVVLFSKFVELVVSDHDLLADFFGVDKE